MVQSDYYCLVVGLLVLAAASIALADALQQSNIFQSGWLPQEDSVIAYMSYNSPSTFSYFKQFNDKRFSSCVLRGRVQSSPYAVAIILIAFGAVTAAAWAVSSRAVLRFITSNASYFLADGVRQEDLHSIFSMTPNLSAS